MNRRIHAHLWTVPRLVVAVAATHFSVAAPNPDPGAAHSGADGPPSALRAALEAVAAWNHAAPIETTASITFGAGPSRAVSGTYRLVRLDSESWREEIRLPGYRRIVVVRNGDRWVEQEGEYRPLRVFDLDELLDFSARHRAVTDGSLRGDQLRKRKPVLRCFDFQQGSSSLELCIDPQDGLLRREILTRHDRMYGWETVITHSELAPLGCAAFPARLEMKRNGKPAVTFVIERLGVPDGSTGASEEPFPPTKVRRQRADCSNTPPIPEFDRTAPVGDRPRVSGDIVARLLVDASGRIRETDVLRSTDPAMASWMRSELARTRWRPGSCDGVPVDSVYLYRRHVDSGAGTQTEP